MQKGGEDGMKLLWNRHTLKFNLSSNKYLVAGLFVPRIGLLNENHLPVNFKWRKTNQLESFIISATWRELGIGLGIF